MSAGRRILFLMFHGQGHFNPAFTIARKLQQDHEVIFSGAEYFKPHVLNQGFSYYPLKTLPFGMGMEKWLNETYKRKPIYLRTLIDRWSDRLYNLREKELSEMLEVCRPTHILLDGHQVTDFIILHKLLKDKSIPIALLHAMPPSTLHPDIPPMNSLSMPDDSSSIKEAHRQNSSARFNKRFKQSIQYLGMNDARIIQRRLKKNGIPSHFISEQNSFVDLTLKGLPEFILSLKSFDLPQRDLGPDSFYIGAHIDHYRKRPTNPDYDSQKQSIEDQKASGNKLIYCSIGTVVTANDIVMTFLRKLILAKPERTTLVISARLDQQRKQELKKDDSVFIFDQVPQLEMLAKTDLFVTHGGLNSIHEAIEAEVPMLVVPLDSNFDCNGNSTRVVYHKIGLRADAVIDTVEQLKEKITLLLDRSIYKTNLKEMKLNNAQSDLKPLYAFFD